MDLWIASDSWIYVRTNSFDFQICHIKISLLITFYSQSTKECRFVCTLEAHSWILDFIFIILNVNKAILEKHFKIEWKLFIYAHFCTILIFLHLFFSVLFYMFNLLLFLKFCSFRSNKCLCLNFLVIVLLVNVAGFQTGI